MFFLKALILGIVEGLTEFLPISSTGHLVIVEKIIKLSENQNFNIAFEVIIQLGAIIAVLLYFKKDIWIFKENKLDKNKVNIWFKIVVGVLPSAVIGLLFEKKIEHYLFNNKTIAAALIFYGIIIIIIEEKGIKNIKLDNIENITYKDAVKIGFFQVLALVPGTSRSAVTIIGGMLSGLNRKTASEFSFFLAIPTLLGAAGLKIIKNGLRFNFDEWMAILTGFVVSFVVAFVVIKFFMNYIRKKDFKIFGYYRIILGIVILVVLS